MRSRMFGPLALLALLSSRAPLQAQVQCSLDTVQGTYAYTYQGTMLVPQTGAVPYAPAPAAALGTLSIDYAGKMTGTGIAVVGDQVLEGEMVNASIQVNPDCTGVARWNMKIKGTDTVLPFQGIDRLIVLAQRGEILTISLGAPAGKPVLLGVWTRISRSF
jgi:hypothetical protein